MHVSPPMGHSVSAEHVTGAAVVSQPRLFVHWPFAWHVLVDVATAGVATDR